MTKIDVMERINSDLDRLIQNSIRLREEEAFNQLKADGDITEAVLILNPKHKGALIGLMNSLKNNIPVIWSYAVEEDKCYMVWDKDLIENIRRMNEWKRPTT